MTGLFSRLAQQQIHQRATSIKPAQEPVFPVEINEKKVRVKSGDDQGGEQGSRNIETEIKNKNTNAETSGVPDNSVVDTPVKNEVEDSELKIKSSINPALKPVINPSINITTPHRVEMPSSSEALITPEAGQTFEPLLPENSHIQQTYFVAKEDKDVTVSKKEEGGFWSDNSSKVKPVNNNHSVVAQNIQNKNVRVTQQFSQPAHDENQTTINISIGQIDIRATNIEKENKKSSVPTPNRNISNALEEYQKKRARGER